MGSLPIIDITYAVENESLIFTNDEKIESLCKSLLDAFNVWGFIYLKGYGIPIEELQEFFDVSARFFALPTQEKESLKTETEDSENVNGYVSFGVEYFDPNKPFDLKEAFDFMRNMEPEMRNRCPKELIDSLEEFFVKCTSLSMVLLKLINKSLNLPDNNFLVNAHSKVGELGNATLLRTINYPGVDKSSIQLEQTRCSEHSDYGTLTLLFQNADGLELQSPTGEFIKATPVPDTVVVNAGDLLERWTSGRIKSTIHRVALPKDSSQPRQSVPYFLIADNDVIVKCLDGSDKYEPIGALDYLTKRYQETLKQ